MPFFNNLFAHCEKTRNSDSQKIFSSNQLFRNPLLSRNFCQKCVRENSRNFHIVICKHILSHWKFREVNWFRTANWFHENLSKSKRFRKFDILTCLHFAFIRERCVMCILDFWFSFFPISFSHFLDVCTISSSDRDIPVNQTACGLEHTFLVALAFILCCKKVAYVNHSFRHDGLFHKMYI